MKIKPLPKGTMVGEVRMRQKVYAIVDENDQVLHVIGRLSGLPVPAVYDRYHMASTELHNIQAEPGRIVA
jgi:hypothetical protein